MPAEDPPVKSALDRAEKEFDEFLETLKRSQDDSLEKIEELLEQHSRGNLDEAALVSGLNELKCIIVTSLIYK